ncbi:MAG: FAD:protein FMN transferase [Oscillospiraceae bacterium]|nr:FAD:protein FMN transferase [Oscillospiraceae bacterium]
MRKISVALASLLLAALLLGGCAPQSRTRTDVGPVPFDTVTSITGFERSNAKFEQVYGRVMDGLAEYHRLFDIYNEYDGINNLRTVNLAAGGEPVEVDARVIALLEFGKEAYELTGGRVNVAMGSVLALWHEAREETHVPPSAEALAEAAKHTDVDDIFIEGGNVRLADPEMSLDVGAIAKGFAVEAVCAQLEAEGLTGWLVSVGGNVRTLGAKGDGSPWRVAVSELSGTDYEDLRIPLVGLSAVTSGGDQRFFDYEGVRYNHIIDPETLFPSERFESVTVVTRDSGLADALSTGLFNMPLEEGLALVESLEGTEALWYLPDGRVVASEGLGGLLG